MEVLVLDGKSYVKASKAAKNLGYATDYVGQLCRSGQVDAHLIGRTWYVNEEELSTHRIEKKRTSRIKAREYAKKTIEEYRAQTEKTANPYKNIAIRYEKDEEKLIPETRKLAISQTPLKKHFENRVDEEVADELEFLNEGEKVLMSGDVPVVDVTDGEVDADTTVLRPGRIRRGIQDIVRAKEAAIPAVQEEVVEPEQVAEVVTEPIPKARISFAERVAAQTNSEDVAAENTSADSTISAEDTTPELSIPNTTRKARPSIVLCVFTVCLVTVMGLLSVGVSAVNLYQSDTTGYYMTKSFAFDLQDAISILKLKI